MLHRIAKERGFAHPRYLLAHLSSSDVTELLAFERLENDPDYRKMLAAMSPEHLKSEVKSLLGKRVKTKKKKAKSNG